MRVGRRRGRARRRGRRGDGAGAGARVRGQRPHGLPDCARAAARAAALADHPAAAAGTAVRLVRVHLASDPTAGSGHLSLRFVARRVHWKFILPGAPRIGGFRERSVRSIDILLSINKKNTVRTGFTNRFSRNRGTFKRQSLNVCHYRHHHIGRKTSTAELN